MNFLLIIVWIRGIEKGKSIGVNSLLKSYKAKEINKSITN